MFSRLWRTECTPFLTGCSHVSKSWLLENCELTVFVFLLPVSCCINLNWPRGNTLVSLDMSACLYPASCLPLIDLCCCFFYSDIRFRSTSDRVCGVECAPPICLLVLCTGYIHRLRLFPAADYGSSALLPTAHHAIIITDHGCRHTLLTESRAIILCCTLQVSYVLIGIVDIG